MTTPTIKHQTITEASVPKRLSADQKIEIQNTQGQTHKLHVITVDPTCKSISGTIGTGHKLVKIELVRSRPKGDWMLHPSYGDDRQRSLAV